MAVFHSWKKQALDASHDIGALAKLCRGPAPERVRPHDGSSNMRCVAWTGQGFSHTCKVFWQNSVKSGGIQEAQIQADALSLLQALNVTSKSSLPLPAVIKNKSSVWMSECNSGSLKLFRSTLLTGELSGLV